MSDEEEEREWSQLVALLQFGLALLTIVVVLGFVIGKLAAWW